MWTWWQHLFTQTSPAANPKAEHWSLRELGQLETQTAWQGSEWYHARLFYIVRRYVEDEWKLALPVPAPIDNRVSEFRLCFACCSAAPARIARPVAPAWGTDASQFQPGAFRRLAASDRAGPNLA